VGGREVPRSVRRDLMDNLLQNAVARSESLFSPCMSEASNILSCYSSREASLLRLNAAIARFAAADRNNPAVLAREPTA
jgi:hypothetical protein